MGAAMYSGKPLDI